jgi:hypothetical protein
MPGFPDAGWLRRFQDIVERDREMRVVGEWFTTALSLTFGEARTILRIEKGRIAEIVSNPRLDVRCAFGFRAPIDVWRKFLSPQPPPLYHDFFAMLIRVPEFVLEGDGLVAMQNARALHRMMNLMREVGTIDA